MPTILSGNFNTPLGIIRSWIDTDNTDINKINSFDASTGARSIQLEAFELQNDWLPAEMQFETSKGWRWHIKKTSSLKENLVIYCKLIDPIEGTTWSTNSGEHLDAIEIENKIHHLHIGTEDGEVLQSRAASSNEMPNRFKDELGIGDSFTHYDGFGFKTIVPELNENETIYFHFLVATNTIKPNEQYPDERDVSTWYAVERSKDFLDKYLKEGKDKM